LLIPHLQWVAWLPKPTYPENVFISVQPKFASHSDF
jgi:hypothetical protein